MVPEELRNSRTCVCTNLEVKYLQCSDLKLNSEGLYKQVGPLLPGQSHQASICCKLLSLFSNLLAVVSYKVYFSNLIDRNVSVITYFILYIVFIYSNNQFFLPVFKI